MRTLGVFLLFAAVVLRAAVVLADRPKFFVNLVLLFAYGLLLFGETLLRRVSRPRFSKSIVLQISYLFVQSVLVIWVMVLSSYEDFLAMLLIPLSLEAVSFFGRRVGYILIATFSLAMVFTLLFSDVGSFFGLVMGILYTGIYFLFGGYASQVQKARTTHDQNERLFNELQTTHRQLQQSADQVATLAIEHERSRLARELHDSVTQTVFSMNLSVQSVHMLLEKQPALAFGQLLRLEELAASALREVQSVISQLKPRSSMEDGLPVALRYLARECKVQYGLQVSLEVHGTDTLDPGTAANLYSIAHEALINVSKHSGSCEAIVHLHIDKERAWLDIEDYGRGFDPTAAPDQRGHLGLTGMFERAREIGWELTVQSRPGQGTCIRVISNPPGAWQ